MKKLFTILLIFISAISFGQIPNTHVAYLYGDSATYMGNRDTVGYHPTRAGAIVFHYNSFWGWNGTRWSALASGGCDTCTITYQPLVIDATLGGGSYTPASPKNIGADTTNYLFTIYKASLLSNSDSAAITYIVDSIANAPLGTEANGTKYLVGTSPTGLFASHANQIATKTGGTWSFVSPTSQQQVIVDNSTNYTSYQFNGTYPTGTWVSTSILWRVSGNAGIGQNAWIGRQDNKPFIIKIRNHEVARFTTDSTIQYTKFKNQDSSLVYFTVDANGKQVLGHFVAQTIYVDSVSTNAGGDSLIVYKNSIRYAYKLPNAGGSGTVTNVSSADVNATVATQTTTPVITIISAPKLLTGRTISLTGDGAYTSGSFDGSGNVTGAFTLATVNSNVGSFGDATHVMQATINAKGLVTAASSVAITGFAPTFTVTAPITYSANVIGITQAATGANGYLSSTDWNTFNGKDAVVTVSSPLVRTVNNITIPAATTSVNGYLTSTDWNTFNNKGSGTVTTFSSGNLSPLFTTSVATATTTPAQTFALSNAAANTVLGNATSGSTAPSYGQIVNGQITNATIVASTKLSATGTPSASTVLYGNDTWGTVSGGSSSSYKDSAWVYLDSCFGNHFGTGGNYAAFMAAQAKLPARGGVIILGAGDYLLDSLVTFTKSIRLLGAGEGTMGAATSDYVTGIITHTAATSMFKFTKNNPDVEHILLWNDNYTSPTGTAIQVRAYGFSFMHSNIAGFSTGIDIDSCAYFLLFHSSFLCGDSNVVVKNSAIPDDGDSRVIDCKFFSGINAGQFAMFVQHSSGGLNFIGCKFNASLTGTKYAYYGDFNAGFTSNLTFDAATSIENGYTTGIYVKSNAHFFGNIKIYSQFSSASSKKDIDLSGVSNVAIGATIVTSGGTDTAIKFTDVTNWSISGVAISGAGLHRYLGGTTADANNDVGDIQNYPVRWYGSTTYGYLMGIESGANFIIGNSKTGKDIFRTLPDNSGSIGVDAFSAPTYAWNSTGHTATINTAATDSLVVNGQLKVANSFADIARFIGTSASRSSFYIQNTNSVAAEGMNFDNDRGGFASYAGFSYGNTANGTSLFGQTRADKFFIYADGGNNLGWWQGTLNNVPWAVGTNNTERFRIGGGGLWSLNTTAGTAGQIPQVNAGATAMQWASVSTLAGAGVEANADLTAQTSAGTITSVTSAAANSTYDVGGYINVTAISVDVIQAQITYTDENNTAQTISLANVSAIGNSSIGVQTIRVKASTTITLKTNLTTGAGSITFDAGGYIKKDY